MGNVISQWKQLFLMANMGSSGLVPLTSVDTPHEASG